MTHNILKSIPHLSNESSSAKFKLLILKQLVTRANCDAGKGRNIEENDQKYQWIMIHPNHHHY